jgi:hypothetical protein
MTEIMTKLGSDLLTLLYRRFDVTRISDCVPSEHRSCLPAAHVHDGGLRNTRSAKFPRC